MASIVIATDLSDNSRPAFDAGIRLAKDLGASVLLVHAFPSLGTAIGIAGGAVPRDIQKAREGTAMEDALALSEKWLAKARDLDVDAEALMDTGDAVDLVLAAAQDNDAAFIVVGSHGRTGLRRALVGSVAEAILRGSTRPVLVVPGPKD